MTGQATMRATATVSDAGWRAPPIGQGLAVIAVLAAVALLSALGIAMYVASLRIAAERAVVDRLDRAIAARRDETAALRREYAIRSRLPELDRWRVPLDLQPVRLGQLVERRDEVFAAAQARRADLDETQAATTVAAAPVDTPRRTGYPQAARTRLDDLVGAIDAQ